jgi:DNA adenine methylase
MRFKANLANAMARERATAPARPFLKWAGGKSQLLPQLRSLLPPPDSFARYHEVFLGGGALFFELSRSEAHLTDLNAELVACYRAVRDDVEAVISALLEHRYEKQHFYEVRAWDPATLNAPERAARMIFLNKTAFNGLYRVNSGGRFNVPFGRHKNPLVCDADNLRACSAALASAELEVADFSTVVTRAQRGDFVYFDPPYVPVSGTANFTSYSAGGFSWEDQRRLADVLRALSKKQVKWMLSNSDAPQLRELYADFRLLEVAATRRINSRADGRGKIGEIVVLNYAGTAGAEPI